MVPITHFVRAESGADLVLFIIFVVVAGIVNLVKKTAASKVNSTGQSTPTRPHASPGAKDLESFLKNIAGVPQSAETSPPPVVPPPMPGTGNRTSRTSPTAIRRNAHQTSFTPKRHETTVESHRQRLDVTEQFQPSVRQVLPLPTAKTSSFAAKVPPSVEPAHEALSGSKLMTLLRDTSRLKEAVLLREILGPPIALRPIASKPGTIS